jgi:hypothetical protein
VTTEEVSTMKFQVVVLHQERRTQHLDESLNRWEIMTNNGSKSLNNVFKITR